jgi:hypothetical protein
MQTNAMSNNHNVPTRDSDVCLAEVDTRDQPLDPLAARVLCCADRPQQLLGEGLVSTKTAYHPALLLALSVLSSGASGAP